MEKIAVAVRFRPPVSEDACSARCWKVEENSVTLHRSRGTPISGISFTFDRVFDQSCKNLTVYNVLTKSIIIAAVNGFNVYALRFDSEFERPNGPLQPLGKCYLSVVQDRTDNSTVKMSYVTERTAFAYGQTSSGKTYTMNGSEDDPGIIQLAVNDVFSCIEETAEREFLIRVSYMEIYNEEINDLLSVENQKLQIHESLDRGVFVAGLREEIVDCAEQVSKLLILGEANRHFGETNMNVRSSRSHTIFRMVIESKVKETQKSGDPLGVDSIRVSVLNLVDLAGSERIAKTGADGVRLKEGKHINKSLMTLGNVINKLSEGGKQRSHIPYRDSKLTRILQPALGGNAKTSIICTLAPEELHIEETRGTLQFASRAKRITNCAQVNEILTDAALLKRQKLEIEELRRKLEGSHSEVLEQVILKQRNDMLKFELEHDKLAMQLEEEKRSREELENRLKDQQLKIDSLNGLVGFNQEVEFHNNDTSIPGNSHPRTPNVENLPGEFVARRPNYSTAADSSPLPDTLGDKADEDTWLQLNKGFSMDLNMLQMTPTMDPTMPPLPSPEKMVSQKALEEALERCRLLERECDRMREETSRLTQALASSKEEAKSLRNYNEEVKEELAAKIRSHGQLLSKQQGLLQALYVRSRPFML